MTGVVLGTGTPFLSIDFYIQRSITWPQSSWHRTTVPQTRLLYPDYLFVETHAQERIISSGGDNRDTLTFKLSLKFPSPNILHCDRLKTIIDCIPPGAPSHARTYVRACIPFLLNAQVGSQRYGVCPCSYITSYVRALIVSPKYPNPIQFKLRMRFALTNLSGFYSSSFAQIYLHAIPNQYFFSFSAVPGMIVLSPCLFWCCLLCFHRHPHLDI